jgi:hypothetical protein
VSVGVEVRAGGDRLCSLKGYLLGSRSGRMAVLAGAYFFAPLTPLFYHQAA